LKLAGLGQQPPILLLQDWNEDIAIYQNNVQSGAYWRSSEQVAWTDGARKLITDRGLCVGAGAYSETTAQLNFSERIGGEAVPIWGEMGAIALVLQQADKQRSLTILTDSLSTMQKMQRYARHDFGQQAERELHWDILEQILTAIRERTAHTTIVWVKGHSGDPGNTVADMKADAGCEEKDALFPRTTTPIKLYQFDGTLLSPNGWSQISNRKKYHLNKGKIRDCLQMIGNAFPKIGDFGP